MDTDENDIIINEEEVTEDEVFDEDMANAEDGVAEEGDEGVLEEGGDYDDDDDGVIEGEEYNDDESGELEYDDDGDAVLLEVVAENPAEDDDDGVFEEEDNPASDDSEGEEDENTQHMDTSLTDSYMLEDISLVIEQSTTAADSLEQKLPPLVPQPVYTDFNDSLAKFEKLKVGGTHSGEFFPLLDYAEQHFNLFEKRRWKKPLSRDVMGVICWQKEAMTTSVRQLPSDLTKHAIQAFRNISGFMGNRTTGKRQNDHCLKLLRNVMVRPEEFRDEVYCQLCKQTTSNPSAESTIRGWQLMVVCLSTFPPTADFKPTLQQYCEYYVSFKEELVSRYAMSCLEALSRHSSYKQRQELPCMEEIVAIQDHESVPLAIYLIDGSFQTIDVNSWTTSDELGQIMAKNLGITFTEPFGVFEVSSNQEERKLDKDERVLDVYAQWQRMKNEQRSKLSRHGDKVQDYSLVYKVFLYVDVDDDQAEEVNMMFMQAVYDVTNAIYSIDIEDYTHLGALQMQFSFGEYDEDNVADLVSNLSTYIPQSVIDDGNSNEIIGSIVEKYHVMPSRTKQQAKLAYLKYCEAWKLYGSSFYFVQNKRNRKLPVDLILAVNRKGISLVDPASNEIIYQFLYGDVVSWGFSERSFLCVTGTVDEEVKNFFKTELGETVSDMVTSYVNMIVKGSEEI